MKKFLALLRREFQTVDKEEDFPATGRKIV